MQSRLDEVNFKHDQIRRLLEAHGAKALQLGRICNVAWFTGGADSSIPIDTSFGVYSIVITPDKRIVYADNIETPRIKGEDPLEELGFEFHTYPWHVGGAPDGDGLITDAGPVDAELKELRSILTPLEQARAAALGKDAGDAVEAAARAVQKGDTEYEIAARVVAEARKRGGQAVVNLIATDERISQYRHPLATDKKVDKLAMLVICMRRDGLIVSATRFVHLGAMPAELNEKLLKVASIDAAAIAGTRPGRTQGDVFADLQAAYAAQGEADQWQNHHQGGLAGYQARELIAGPGDGYVIKDHQLYAWNPSIVGCKSEDTILLNGESFSIISETGNWPTVSIDVNGQSIRRPGILEL